MAGNFGYELDATKLSDEVKEKIKIQIADYKRLRGIIQYGDFYRLLSPFKGNHTAWMFVSEDKKEAVVFFYRIMNIPNDALFRFRLAGLSEDLIYEIEGMEQEISGQQLMNYGLNIPKDFAWGDFGSRMFVLKAK